MKTLKLALAVAPLLALAFLLMYLMTQYTVDKEENRQRLILCAVSVLCNAPVIYVHLRYPPHPKYLMLPLRKFSIRVHVFSGIIEFTAAIIAWSTMLVSGTESQIFALFATVMACAALFGHIPSSAYQTLIVFGTRAVMLPAYVLCIALHFFCAVNLLLEPRSEFWLYNTFLAFNVYTWVRVFYFAFCKLKLLDGSRYTVAVLCAGAMMGPAVLGPAAILFLFAFICVFDVIYWLLFRKTHEFSLFLKERQRNTYHSEELRQIWVRLKLAGLTGDVKDLTDREKAKKLFDTYDTDDSGLLSADEVETVLKEWDVSETFRNDLVRYLTKKGGVNFDRFYRYLWCLGNTRWLERQDARNLTTPKEKAEFIFDLIDLDDSGRIEAFELKTLLFAWGLPEEDVEECLKHYGPDLEIDFDEFFEKMSPIWKFAYYDVIGLPLQKRTWHMS